MYNRNLYIWIIIMLKKLKRKYKWWGDRIIFISTVSYFIEHVFNNVKNNF